MIILGIDPGTQRVGYGVIQVEYGRTELLSAGILKVSPGDPLRVLPEIHRELGALIKTHRPQALAIEKLFFMKNQKTAFAVAQARGVILLAAIEAGLKIYEFAPNEVKSGLTGYGHADKGAVLKIVRLILGAPGLKVIDDASDALAIALFASQHQALRTAALDKATSSPILSPKSRKGFIKQSKGRVL